MAAPKLSDYANLPGYPKFNTLVGCLPQTIEAEAKLRAKALERGITYKIADFGGIRTPGIVDLLMFYRMNDYAVAVKNNPAVGKIPIQKWRPISPWAKSRHRFGGAFDVIILTAPKGMSTSDAYKTLGALAEKYCNLKWGGNFKDPQTGEPIPDPKHFELTPPMSALEVLWNDFQKGATNVASTVTTSVAQNKAATSLVLVLLAVLVGMRMLRA